MQPPSHQTIVITGAAHGLGRALAHAFHRRGFRLALLDVDQEGLGSLRASLPDDGRLVSVHAADVSAEAQVRLAVREIIRQHGHIYLLINNAGISISQPFSRILAEDFRKLMEINFWGMVHCTRHVLPHLRTSRRGHIAFIASGFAHTGFPGKTAYAASKGAATSFSNALSTELAGSGIGVSLIIPPPLATELVRTGQHINEEKRAAEQAFLSRHGMAVDEAAERIARGILKGRPRIVVGAGMWLQDLAARLFPTIMQRLIIRFRERFDFI